MDHIFGYGSLVLEESREHTGDSGQDIPVEVNGFRREWHQRINNETYLGIVESPDDKCNGVLIEIPHQELKNFDEREVGYSREKVDPDQIESSYGQSLPDSDVWIYLPDDEVGDVRPTEEDPIVQSYLDVVLKGCLNISREFAEDFIDQTSKWGPIVNDRDQPIYPRSTNVNGYRQEIDELVAELEAENESVQELEREEFMEKLDNG